MDAELRELVEDVALPRTYLEPEEAHDLTVADVLGPGGLLARAIAGYEQRPQQLKMADLVAQSIDRCQCAVIEAGTGVGKSLAYLVPAILSEHSVVVSTANKTLQAQLVGKDLPLLQRILSPAGYPFTFTVAKGKSNYLCLDKVRLQGLPDPAYEEWAATTTTGDVDEAPWTPSAEERRQMCVGDDCLRSACPFFSQCFYYAAKAQRQDADVVVTNHAMLLQHVAMPQAGILPEAPVCVVDEAHQLETYAVGAYSEEITEHSFRGPAGSLAGEGKRFVAELAKASGYGDKTPDGLIHAQYTFEEGLALALALRELASSIAAAYTDDLEEAARREAKATAEREQVRNLADRVQRLAEPTPRGFVRHVTRRRDYLVAQLTKHDVASDLAAIPLLYHTVVYTSATIGLAGDFSHFCRRNGAAYVQTLELGSPFDYSRQCLLYLPRLAGLPKPDYRLRDRYDEAARAQMLQLVQASGGGALLLFTSYYAMNRAADWLASRLRLPVRRQGEAGRPLLVEWLRRTPRGVLCATASFWEGVDVSGDSLRLVVIDKIPFAAPGPVEQARQLEAGPRAFAELSIPEAALRLKQGFGRLIRSASDRGVVAILDPRLWSEPYGRKIIGALPDAQVTYSLDDVRAFYGGREEAA
jgi:ATP-dependent DNA helicase DinG